MCKREERPLFQGVTYSVGEENPDQTVFLNDLEVPGDLGEERGVPARGELPLSLAAVLGLSRSCPHFGEPPHVAQIKPPVPVRAAVGIGGCAVHPCEQQDGQRHGLVGGATPQKEAWH